MKVREFMSRGVEVVEPDIPLHDAAMRMRAYQIGVLPVCEKGRLVGMLTDRDIVTRAVAEEADPKKTPVRDAMTRNPTFCYEHEEIADVAKVMEEKKIRRIPVMSKEQKLVGLLSLGDFTKRWEGQYMVAEVLEAVAARH